MNLEPPSGSRISVTTDAAHPLIVIPHGSGGLMRYFVGLFLLAWLGGWFLGFSSAVSKLSSGQAPPSSSSGSQLGPWVAPTRCIWLIGRFALPCRSS